MTGAVDFGAAVDDATALAVCVFFTGPGAAGFSIAAGVACGLATAGVEDGSGAVVAIVFEARSAVGAGCCDDVAASIAAPALT